MFIQITGNDFRTCCDERYITKPEYEYGHVLCSFFCRYPLKSESSEFLLELMDVTCIELHLKISDP